MTMTRMELKHSIERTLMQFGLEPDSRFAELSAELAITFDVYSGLHSACIDVVGRVDQIMTPKATPSKELILKVAVENTVENGVKLARMREMVTVLGLDVSAPEQIVEGQITPELPGV
jgi:hypothetical protein